MSQNHDRALYPTISIRHDNRMEPTGGWGESSRQELSCLALGFGSWEDRKIDEERRKKKRPSSACSARTAVAITGELDFKQKKKAFKENLEGLRIAEW